MWSDPFNPHNTRTEEVRTIAEVVSKLREQWTADTSKGGEARFQWLKQYFENLAQKSKTFPEFKFYTTQAEYFKSLNLATPLDNVIKALTARLRALDMLATLRQEPVFQELINEVDRIVLGGQPGQPQFWPRVSSGIENSAILQKLEGLLIYIHGVRDVFQDLKQMLPEPDNAA